MSAFFSNMLIFLIFTWACTLCEASNHLRSKNKVTKPLKILVYTPNKFAETWGGIVALHNLAKILHEIGHDVKMYCPDKVVFDANEKPLFGIYTTQPDKNAIAIYPEGLRGNPIGAKIVVRWILAAVGTFKGALDYNAILKSWNDDDLVYHFFLNGANNNKYDNVFRKLSPLYVNPIFTPPTNLNESEKYNIQHRPLVTYTMHKANQFHPNGINTWHPAWAIPLEALPHSEYVPKLQKSHTFYCYDPQSFMAQMAVLCGCITVVYPVHNYTEAEYWDTTSFGTYLRARKNVSSFYGIAYGRKHIHEARRTIHLAGREIDDMVEYYKQSVYQFIDDMYAWNVNSSALPNTIKNTNYKNMAWRL